MTNSTRRFHLGNFLGNLALNTAAMGGLICILLVPLALFFNISLVMFKTGSMSPTIPAGSLSVVRQIPASEIQVGDIVTVDRPGALPVTHRVTTIASGPTEHERTITLKGDANTTEDPAPYTVSTVKLAVFSVPNLAYVVVWFSNPWVLGSLTLALTALVTWAFWPRARHLAHDGSALAPTHHEGLAKHAATHHPGHTVQVLLLITAVTASTLIAAVPSARAVESDTIVVGTYITLTSVTDLEEFSNMSPGKTVQWQVGVSVSAPKAGTITLATSATGSAAMGLTSQARSCATRWVGGVCSGGETLLQPTQPIPLDSTDRTLATMPSSQERWFLFDVTMPLTSTGVSAGESVSMLFRATGVEDDVTVGPGSLAATGTNGPTPWPAALAVIAAIGVGLGLAGLASVRRRRES